MIDIELYLDQLLDLLKAEFGSRLVYMGLQGSYLRGEATAESDIDIMLVIDSLCPDDLDAYRSILQRLGHFEKACGFTCSKEDLAHWNPLELCHLVHTTQDCWGVLADLIPGYTREDARNFVKLSLNNLNHELTHRYIYATPDHNKACLPMTYKSVFFILQDLYCLTHGVFVQTKAELLSVLEGNDRAVLQRAMDMSRGADYDYEDSFRLLYRWVQDTLKYL